MKLQFLSELYWKVTVDGELIFSSSPVEVAEYVSGSLKVSTPGFSARIRDGKVELSHPAILGGEYLVLKFLDNEEALRLMESVSVKDGVIASQVWPAFIGCSLKRLVPVDSQEYGRLNFMAIKWSLLTEKTTDFQPFHRYGIPGELDLWYLGGYSGEHIFLTNCLPEGSHRLSEVRVEAFNTVTTLSQAKVLNNMSVISTGQIVGMYDMSDWLYPDMEIDEFFGKAPLGMDSTQFALAHFSDYYEITKKARLDITPWWPTLLNFLADGLLPLHLKDMNLKASIMSISGIGDLPEYMINELVSKVSKLKEGIDLTDPNIYLDRPGIMDYYNINIQYYLNYQDILGGPFWDTLKGLVRKVHSNIPKYRNLVSNVSLLSGDIICMTISHRDLIRFVQEPSQELLEEMIKNKFTSIQVKYEIYSTALLVG